MEILLILTVGALNIACFFIGAKVGQTVAKGEKLKAPEVKLNPIYAIREHEERKEAKRKQERTEAILRNIDNYNGTSIGQEDVPRG
jgi:hypothetical protein